ncbi:pentapeptide repeat-containing protein [Microbacterium sp.]|uniref:pentapeptide repeat-containing protein n=1 Tax=Microbacterium sp. TaxID=51671 RepID=UPI0039E4C4C2
MVARKTAPLTPRISPPDLPDALDAVRDVRSHSDLLAVEIGGISGDVSVAHSHIAEARIEPSSVDRFDATGAQLVDVAIDRLRAVELIGRDGGWRNVELTGGRVATLDGLRARWDSVVLRGVHVDYLSLASASLSDVLFVDCRFDTIDLPQARLTRVAFEGCRADEVDTRGLRGSDLDLRGLEALAFTDLHALSGAWLDAAQAELHAVAFAQALGIRVAG